MYKVVIIVMTVAMELGVNWCTKFDLTAYMVGASLLKI